MINRKVLLSGLISSIGIACAGEEEAWSEEKSADQRRREATRYMVAPVDKVKVSKRNRFCNPGCREAAFKLNSGNHRGNAAHDP